MNRERILEQLVEERNRLTRAIEALEGARASRRGPKAGAKKRTGGITAAGRKRLSEMMKKRWAERKKKTNKGK